MKTVGFLTLFVFAFHCLGQKTDFESINFQIADNKALEYKNDRLDNLPLLSYHLTSQLPTDVEKFRAIYRWVCNNIANDYQLYDRNMHKRQRYKEDSLKLKRWNEKFRKISFQKLRDDHKAICTGYAYLVKELSTLANINCEVVHGYARTSSINIETLTIPNHSWNAVELNGKWYLCDPTWASGIPNADTFQFEFSYNDGFFLANPHLFAINHFPQDTKWLLIDKDAPSFEDFLEAPILYGKAYANLKRFEAPKKLDNTIQKNETFTIKCELLRSIHPEEISLVIDSGSNRTKIHPKHTTVINTVLTIEYAFEHSGFYDVHLYIGTDLIMTTTFRVKS